MRTRKVLSIENERFSAAIVLGQQTLIALDSRREAPEYFIVNSFDVGKHEARWGAKTRERAFLTGGR